MDRSCLKCGRFIEIFDQTYLDKQAEFNRSIQDLEAMLTPFLEDIEKARAVLEELQDKEPPPPPTEFPWDRKS